MLGHLLFRYLSEKPDLDVYATARRLEKDACHFPQFLIDKIISNIDINEFDSVINVLSSLRPKFVINCAAVTDFLSITKNLVKAVSINSIFPHRLSLLCNLLDTRLIHIGTDGVFDGKKGDYTENDAVSISDIYGMTKYLGELRNPGCVTLRLSIIGHEIKKKTGLVEWFLSQDNNVRGYTRAIYSGLPTVELAEIIYDYILPNDNLSGIYHVSSNPISKYDLLHLIAARYGKTIQIDQSDEVIIDRSLNSNVFRGLTGYNPPSWPELINKMYLDYIKHKG